MQTIEWQHMLYEFPYEINKKLWMASYHHHNNTGRSKGKKYYANYTKFSKIMKIDDIPPNKKLNHMCINLHALGNRCPELFNFSIPANQGSISL
jgi:hypothetical protein